MLIVPISPSVISLTTRLYSLFELATKKTSTISIAGLCDGSSPVTAESHPLILPLLFTVTGGFPSQKASNAESVSISWRHHVCVSFFSPTGLLLITPPSSPVMKSTRATLEASGAPYQMLSRTELRKRFPQLDFPDDVEGLYDGDAGAVRAERGVMGMQVRGNKAGWNRVLL